MPLDKKTELRFKEIAEKKRLTKQAEHRLKTKSDPQEEQRPRTESDPHGRPSGVRRRYGEFPAPTGPREPCVPSESNNPRLVGTAFDYLLRFYIERLNPAAIKGPWYAVKTLAALEDLFASRSRPYVQIGWFPTENGLAGYYGPDQHPEKTLARLHALVDFARREYHEYLTSGKVSRSLLLGCSILAKLDWIGRSRYLAVPMDLDSRDDLVLSELEKLIGAVDRKHFVARTRCVLNPRFDHDSLNCDADLLIDDRLIEIKVTSQYRNDPRDWDQLFHYYACYRLVGTPGVRRNARIRRIGIYSARFARYQEIPLEGEYLMKAEEYCERLRQNLLYSGSHS